MHIRLLFLAMCFFCVTTSITFIIFITESHIYDKCLNDTKNIYMYNDWFCIDNTKVPSDNDYDVGYPTDLIPSKYPFGDTVAKDPNMINKYAMKNPTKEHCDNKPGSVCDGNVLNPVHNHLIWMKEVLYCSCLQSTTSGACKAPQEMTNAHYLDPSVS